LAIVERFRENYGPVKPSTHAIVERFRETRTVETSKVHIGERFAENYGPVETKAHGPLLS
jgi:hypothetical protein